MMEHDRIMCRGCGSGAFNFICVDKKKPFVHCANCGANMLGVFVVLKERDQIEN